MIKLFLLIIVISIPYGTAYRNNKRSTNNFISCKDENNQYVDWFYLYKMPNHYPSQDESKDKGADFFYLTSNSTSSEWKLSERKIDDRNSMAGLTILQSFIEKDQTDRLIVAYNDEPPGQKTDNSHGHTKGLLVADDTSGFWLIHSVPKFPEIFTSPSQYSYPPTGRMYGQSFLCISTEASEINKIGLQLIYNEPHIYTYKISSQLREKYPNVAKLIDNEKITKSPYWNEVNIESSDGNVFKSFAKSRKFHKELYEDWVAPVLDTNLYVETWQRGPGALPSNCSSKDSVWNVSEMKFNNFEFTSKDDHSKWAVAASENSDWICVGDINRAEHQEERGGGTVCQRSSTISNAYRSAINSFDQCSNDLHKKKEVKKRATRKRTTRRYRYNYDY